MTKGETLILLGGGALIGLWLIKKLGGTAAVATNAIASGAASVIEALTFGPAMQVVGGIEDQAGNYLGPIASFPAATRNGNTYLQINGKTYQMGPRDTSTGYFTAIPVG